MIRWTTVYVLIYILYKLQLHLAKRKGNKRLVLPLSLRNLWLD